MFPATSHPSRGAWIEISGLCPSVWLYNSRTPHGVRGLKLPSMAVSTLLMVSHPSRGAWIEIEESCPVVDDMMSHPSRGAWIEISSSPGLKVTLLSRTPHGVRGLKSQRHKANVQTAWSHPSRGAWIEINRRNFCLRFPASHPSRGAWIEIYCGCL